VTRRARRFDIDVRQWPALAAFMQRVGERASVKAALNAESQARKAA
jgi:glutathione S-transferase